MRSKIEYIDKTAQDIRLPREVYYRCLWTVRDLPRLRQLAELASGISGTDSGFAACDAASGSEHAVRTAPGGAASVSDSESIAGSRILSEKVIARAAFDVDCISAAIGRVPEVYRKGIMDNIVSRIPFDDLAHPNTWKRWKLVFLYELARELQLI